MIGIGITFSVYNTISFLKNEESVHPIVAIITPIIKLIVFTPITKLPWIFLLIFNKIPYTSSNKFSRGYHHIFQPIILS